MTERSPVVGNAWKSVAAGPLTVKITAYLDGAQYAIAADTPSEATATLVKGVRSAIVTVPTGSNLYLQNTTLVGGLTDVIRVDDVAPLSVVLAGAEGGPTTVAKLPTASAALAGSRAFVTDASATTFMSTVAAGGSNKVPVVCDGTNWKIG